MNWVVRIADDVKAFIDGLPAKARDQISRNISDIEQDPFRGDVTALQGKRSGRYRIIFFVHHTKQLVDIGWVVLRSEKTYR
jgi:mRNA-degrading endonuclease RelE of RelBE toxin-antitoxin system